MACLETNHIKVKRSYFQGAMVQVLSVIFTSFVARLVLFTWPSFIVKETNTNFVPLVQIASLVHMPTVSILLIIFLHTHVVISMG